MGPVTGLAHLRKSPKMGRVRVHLWKESIYLSEGGSRTFVMGGHSEFNNIFSSPVKTLGILDMKLFTVRIGTPNFSSCIR